MGKKNDIGKIPLMEQIYFGQEKQKATQNTILSYISSAIAIGFLILSFFVSILSVKAFIVCMVAAIFSIFASFYLVFNSVLQKSKIDKRILERAKELKTLENDLGKRLNKLNQKEAKNGSKR